MRSRISALAVFAVLAACLPVALDAGPPTTEDSRVEVVAAQPHPTYEVVAANMLADITISLEFLRLEYLDAEPVPALRLRDEPLRHAPRVLPRPPNTMTTAVSHLSSRRASPTRYHNLRLRT